MINIPCKNIWVLLSLLPSLIFSSVMVEDQLRFHAFSRPLAPQKEIMPNPSRVPQKVTLSRDTEEKVKETLEGGLVNMNANEAAYVSSATQKTRALFVSLYCPSERPETAEKISLQSIFSSEPMQKAQISLADMERELSILTEKLSTLAGSATLRAELVSTEKDLGVYSRAIRGEKEKEKDPNNPANLRAIEYLKEKEEKLKEKKKTLEGQIKLIEEDVETQIKRLEEKKERKEQEIFVHSALIKLREKRDLLSQAIREEESRPKVNIDKLKFLRDRREALDAEGLDPIFTQSALRMMQQEDERLALEQKKISFSKLTVSEITRKRSAIRSAMEKFAEVRDQKRRIKRVLSLIKEKLNPAEIDSLILGERALMTKKTFFADRIILLERLAALPPQIRQKLMTQAQRFINPAMSGEDRALIAKSFAQFEKAEDGEQFSKDLALNKDLSFNREGTLTPKFIQRAANTWRASRHKFRDSLRKIRSFRLGASQELVDNFLRLSPDVQDKFLSLFPSSLSPEETHILYVLTGIERDNQGLRSREPETKWGAEADIERDIQNIEAMAKFKEHDPLGYAMELKKIFAYYKRDPDTCLSRILEEKRNSEKEALRKLITKQLLEATLRASIKKEVEKELDVENIRKAHLKKSTEPETPDSTLLRIKSEGQLTRKVEKLTSQRFAEALKRITPQEKQKMAVSLAEEVEEHLTAELRNIKPLQIHPLLAPFDAETSEEDNDVFEDRKESRKDLFERKKQSAPPPSPIDSGNESAGESGNESAGSPDV